MSLAWGPTSTKNTFLATDQRPRDNAGPSARPTIGGSARSRRREGLTGARCRSTWAANEGVAYDSARTDGATSAEVGALYAADGAFTVSAEGRS